MVPHIKVEEAVTSVLGGKPSAVTAVPDERKGERLVVFYTEPDVSGEELSTRLGESGLPNLWMPKRESFHFIDEIPLLGSGKTDLKKIRAMALEMAT